MSSPSLTGTRSTSGRRLRLRRSAWLVGPASLAAMTRRETAFGAGVAYPRPRPAWPMAHRRGRRTGHPGPGPRVHHPPAVRLPRRPTAAEFEGRFHATQQAATARSKSKSPSLYKTQSGSSLESAHDRLRVSSAAMSRAAGSSSTGTDPAVMVRWILCPRRRVTRLYGDRASRSGGHRCAPRARYVGRDPRPTGSPST